MYLFAVQTVIVPFDCASVPGRDLRVVESTGMACFAGDWWGVAAGAFASLLLCVLWPVRKILSLGKQSANDISMHELLFGKYERGKERYEAATMALKAATAMVTTLFSTFPLLQMLAVLALQCGALALLRREQPYLEQRDDDVDGVLLACTVVQLLLGLLAYAGVPQELVIAVFLLVLLFQGVRVWQLARKESEGAPEPRVVNVMPKHKQSVAAKRSVVLL